VKSHRERTSLLLVALSRRVSRVLTHSLPTYNAVDVEHSKHSGKAAAREAVVNILRGHKSLSADLKEALTVERVVPRNRQLVEQSLPRLKAKYLTQNGAGDMSSPDLRLYNALEDYKKMRDEEEEVSTAEKNKAPEKKATLLLARSIATGKISRVANSIAGDVQLPASPGGCAGCISRKREGNLDLVSDDVDLDDGGCRERWHSAGDEDEDAGRCAQDGAAGASAPTVSLSRFLKRARGADRMHATKAHKKSALPQARWWRIFKTRWANRSRLLMMGERLWQAA
jgi:hypothetical protein